MNSKKERLLEQLKNKEYRDAFVAEMISTGIPFQIRALRKQRNWSQQKMSEETGMMQERISILEDPNYGKLTLTTLKKLASALDIGLLVRFVPISDLVKWELKLSADSLKALSYPEDPYFKIKTVEPSTIDFEAENQKPNSLYGKLYYLKGIQEQKKTAIPDEYKPIQKIVLDTPALKSSMGGYDNEAIND